MALVTLSTLSTGINYRVNNVSDLAGGGQESAQHSALFPLLPDRDVEIVGVLRSATGGHSNINQLHCALRVSLGGENRKYKCIFARHVSKFIIALPRFKNLINYYDKAFPSSPHPYKDLHGQPTISLKAN